MTILLVVADLGLGGAQQVVINLANGFAAQGHKVGVWDVYPGHRIKGVTDRIVEQVDLIGEQPINSPSGWIDKIMNSLLYRTGIQKNYWKKKQYNRHERAIINWVKIEQPEVVNSHIWWADQWVFRNQSWLPENWWITMHGSYTAMMKHHQREAFLFESPKVISSCLGFIYLSENELETIKNIPGWDEKPRYKVPNGLPKPPFSNLSREQLGLTEDHFVLFCASRAIREKGWGELVESIGLLRDEYPNIRLLLAGDGPFRRELEPFTKCAEIQFLGYRSDVAALISISDCIVLPSYSEAFPTILLEALQQNVPIIATSVGEVEDMLTFEDGTKGGSTIALNNEGIVDSKVLTNTIRQMLDPMYYSAIKENLNRHEFKYTLEQQIATYNNIFQGGHP